jgi:hypothetical protein
MGNLKLNAMIDPIEGSQCILLNTHEIIVNYVYFLVTEVVLALGTVLGLCLGPSSGQKLWKIMYYQVRNLQLFKVEIMKDHMKGWSWALLAAIAQLPILVCWNLQSHSTRLTTAI